MVALADLDCVFAVLIGMPSTIFFHVEIIQHPTQTWYPKNHCKVQSLLISTGSLLLTCCCKLKLSFHVQSVLPCTQSQYRKVWSCTIVIVVYIIWLTLTMFLRLRRTTIMYWFLQKKEFLPFHSARWWHKWTLTLSGWPCFSGKGEETTPVQYSTFFPLSFVLLLLPSGCTPFLSPFFFGMGRTSCISAIGPHCFNAKYLARHHTFLWLQFSYRSYHIQ
jgi:hypothetical protein